MGWFGKTEYKVVMKPYIIKGKTITVIFNNGNELSELIKDEVRFYDHLGCKMLSNNYSHFIYSRLNSDLVALKIQYEDILIPKTSILKIVVGPEQIFETVEVYSHLE